MSFVKIESYIINRNQYNRLDKHLDIVLNTNYIQQIIYNLKLVQETYLIILNDKTEILTNSLNYINLCKHIDIKL